MRSAETMPILPYPAFDISRYAPLAAKISKENDFIAGVVGKDRQVQNTQEISDSFLDIAILSLAERDGRLQALNAAEEYLNLALDLNKTFKRTLDTYL